MKTYKCYTNKYSWSFDAQDDFDAVRLALYYCWRDGELFNHVETSSGESILLCTVDNKFRVINTL